MTTVIICAGGPPEQIIDLRQYRKEETIFIGADRGAFHLLQQNIIPLEAVGDFDSVSTNQYEAIKQKVKHVDAYQSEKNETDTELALERALFYKPKVVVLTGVTGGRFDHTMSALHLLYRFQKQHRHILFKICSVRNEMHLLLPGKHRIQKDNAFHYISFFAFHKNIDSITLQGFKYNIERAPLVNGMTKFTSNELLQNEGTISFDEGICLMVRSSDA